MKAIIDPRCKILYASYYIQGLYEVLGKKNVSFSMKYFHNLDMKKESHAFDHYFAFVLIRDNQTYKIIIDYRDKTSIKDSAYQWCDVYAKVNFNQALTPEKYLPKTLSLPPAFGIRLWGLGKTLGYAVRNLFKTGFNIPASIKLFLIYYGASYKRLPLSFYTQKTETRDNYIFAAATLWNHSGCIETTNKFRYNFMMQAQAVPNIDFEGGFLAALDHPEYEKHKGMIVAKAYTRKEYITKTHQSSVVFNTPAVHNCHGWKLGEYIAMGKAVISMPLSNDLPMPLIHGEHIHIINSEHELEPALPLIINSKDYRHKLEQNIKAYYKQYASPEAVIHQILKRLSV